MQNDVLKNKIAPWQEKGRWYHGLWNIGTNAFDADETDDELLHGDYSLSMISNTEYIRPNSADRKIIYVVNKWRSPLTIGSNQTINIGSHRVFTAGVIGIGFAPSLSNSSGLVDVWLFIVSE